MYCILHTDILSLTGNVIKCFLLRLVSFTFPNVTLEIGGDLLLSASSLALISTRAPLMVMKYAMVRCHYHAMISDFNERANDLQTQYEFDCDEQLFPIKVKCKCIHYIHLMPTVNTSIFGIQKFPYLGKKECQPLSMTLSEFVVLKMIKQNISTDNFFTSASLATRLLVKRTILFETIRSNRRQLFQLTKSEKNELERFSIHKRIKLNNDRKRIPETYSAKSKSYRWPVQVSFNILDWAGINVWILYKETSGQNISRQQFLLQIAEELAKEYHEFLQEEKENLQGMSSGQVYSNISLGSAVLQFFGFMQHDVERWGGFTENQSV
ncbi:piggyBac transposable element-derived protein 4-like [Vespula maculifrons]|uniref:PiggyBac transposable element-derived protein 4-like n=1 Tax=Vespula maculifrons TaxID=7453 RepID=A0ABD2AT91_VESMC